MKIECLPWQHSRSTLLISHVRRLQRCRGLTPCGQDDYAAPASKPCIRSKVDMEWRPSMVNVKKSRREAWDAAGTRKRATASPVLGVERPRDDLRTGRRRRRGGRRGRRARDWRTLRLRYPWAHRWRRERCSCRRARMAGRRVMEVLMST